MLLPSRLKKGLQRKFLLTSQSIGKDPLFALLLAAVIILAIFFRVYNYHNRISVVADNSQHVQIARYAHDYFKIPLAGPFSSAGPFYYGPWYFWFLEIVNFIPLGLLTPWYVSTLGSI